MRLHEIEDKQKAKISRVFERWFSFSGEYNIDDDGYVNITGNVALNHISIGGVNPKILSGGKLPVKFKEISGSLLCSGSELISLDGLPQKLGRHLSLDNNKLTSLEGLSEINKSFINGHLNIDKNQLSSLNGCPKIINGDLTISRNPLISLDGLPVEVNGQITFSIIDENFPILRLLLVNNVSQYQVYPNSQKYQTLEEILNKYLGQGRRGAIQCAVELTKAGFKGNARL